jgi:hypothetical protein
MSAVKKKFFFLRRNLFSILMVFSEFYYQKTLQIAQNRVFFIVLLVYSECHKRQLLLSSITEKLKFEPTGVDSSRLAQVKLSQL